MGPADSSRPRLAAGCRLREVDGARLVLFPEGALRVRGTGERILALCDGQRTFAELVALLERDYSASAAGVIRAETARFLEQLHDKRILDY
jgi:pyrroloquinoline quinone biosynthesis protein D